MADNLGGSVAFNRFGRYQPLTSSDWFEHRYFIPSTGKAVFGYYDGTGSDMSIQSTQFGRRIELTIVYNPGSWRVSNPIGLNDTSILTTKLLNFLSLGTIPRVSLNFHQFLGIKAVKVSEFWYRISIGDFDADGTFGGKAYKGIDSWLRAIIHLPHRIIVSPWHEFDGWSDGGGASVAPDGYVNQAPVAGSPKAWFGRGNTTDIVLNASDFRAAWQHLVDRARAIVQAEGGFEPVWSFNPAYNPAAVTSYGKPAWGQNLTDTGCDPGGMYPGHNYVDWVAVDPYNYASVSGHSDRWDTPADLWANYGGKNWWDLNFKIGGHRTIAADVDNKGVYKPMMWGETGTNEYRPTTYNYTSHGQADGDAATWMIQLADLVATGPAAGKLRAVCWFGQDYWNHNSLVTNNTTTTLAVTGGALAFSPTGNPPTFSINGTSYSISFATPTVNTSLPSTIITSTSNTNDPWWFTVPAGTTITQGSNTVTTTTATTLYRKGPGPMSGADTILRNTPDCAQRWPALALLGNVDVFKARAN